MIGWGIFSYQSAAVNLLILSNDELSARELQFSGTFSDLTGHALKISVVL